MTFSTFHTFGITHTLALILNPTRTLPLATTLRLPAASKVGLYVMAITRLCKFHNPAKPYHSANSDFKNMPIYSTDYANFTNQAFILRIMQISQHPDSGFILQIMQIGKIQTTKG